MKINPEMILVYPLVAFVAVINWPWVIGIIVCGGATIIMDEVLHWPKWIVVILTNAILIAAVVTILSLTGMEQTVLDTPCSAPGC